MPIAIEWIVKDRVILSTLEGQISQSDVDYWLLQQMDMVAQGIPGVHHISDSRKITTLDVDSRGLLAMRYTLPRSRDFGWHIEVSANPFVQKTTPLINQFARIDTLSYSTVSDALLFLCDHDTTLHDLIYQPV